MNEEKIVNGLRCGDIEALNEAITEFTAYAYAIAFNILGDFLPQEDIEETVSDTFVSLWYSREKVRRGKLKAYIGTIARNKARDRLRSIKPAQHLEDDYPVARCTEPEAQVLKKEMAVITRDAVDDMGEPDSEIFKRHYFLYQKVDDIVLDMGMKPSAIKVRLKRGREKLRIALGKKGFEYGIIDN